MKKSIREFTGWVKAHSYKACLFAALTATLGAWDGTRPYLDWVDLFPWALLLTAVALVIHWDGKGLSCLLVMALLCQPLQARAVEPKRPSGAGVIIGIVVVVVGGVIVFRVIRFCQRAFPRTPPPNTNPPPATVFGANYALATSCSALGSCYVPSSSFSLLDEPAAITVLEVSGTMVEAPEGGLAFRMAGTKKLPDTDAVDLWEFQQELQAWGVRFGSAGDVFYGLDGQPASPDQVPITVTPNGVNSSVDVSGGYGQAVTFERSSDLQHWEPILTMRVAVDQVVKFSDATDAQQMFYRSRPVGDQ